MYSSEALCFGQCFMLELGVVTIPVELDSQFPGIFQNIRKWQGTQNMMITIDFLLMDFYFEVDFIAESLLI